MSSNVSSDDEEPEEEPDILGKFIPEELKSSKSSGGIKTIRI